MKGVKTMSKIKSNYEMFIQTVNTLKSSQGYYSRLANTIADMNDAEKTRLKSTLNNLPQKFKDSVDVVMFLES